jgi:glycosyltransferase involved in cell wall biosynthesis
MNILFPYMARWKAINWTRYQRVLSAIAEQGHTVHVIQMPAGNSYETNFQEIEINLSPNIHLHELALKGFLWKHNYPFHKLIKKGRYSLACIAAVKRMIREYDIDVMLVYNLTQLPLLNAASCFTIFDFADDYIDMLKFELGVLSNPLILSVGRKVLHRMAARADLTFAVSHVLANSLAGIDHIKVIPNGVDLTTFVPTAAGDAKYKYESPVIGFLGSFEYFIDFDIILAAAQLLPDYTFLMVGSGRRFSEVEKKVKLLDLKNVILTGGVPFHQVPSLINSMDICLNIFKDMPVSHGASPIKLFEYIALKKPVISTRLAEIEIINHDFIFFADTAEELVATIRQILNDAETSSRKVKAAFSYIEKNYTWRHIVEQFLSSIEGFKEHEN